MDETIFAILQVLVMIVHYYITLHSLHSVWYIIWENNGSHLISKLLDQTLFTFYGMTIANISWEPYQYKYQMKLRTLVWA
jgi:hypothetical protein